MLDPLHRISSLYTCIVAMAVMQLLGCHKFGFFLSLKSQVSYFVLDDCCSHFRCYIFHVHF